mgnify:FL=1
MKLVTHKECEPEPESAELTVKKSSYKDCKHKQTEIDRVLRTVRCKRCGETLDPIEVLLNIHSYVEGIRFQADYVANHQKREREKSADRRMKCRRCNKLFKPIPDVNSAFSHWGICDPCWAANPREGMAP